LSSQERASFDPAELAVALSHFDLGVIESITDFPRGSHRSPKVGIVCERGKFLLKRRSVDRVHLDRVRFVHRIQAHLVQAGFPIAKLIASRVGRQTLVQIREHIYELFEFMPGQPYQHTAGEARDAGLTLARLHQSTAQVAPASTAQPRGDYHDAPVIRTGLCAIGARLSSHDSFTGDEAELASLVQFLLEHYDRAAEIVNAAGFSAWPEQIIHSDWHPGNLLFRNLKVIAVIDYDSIRYSRRAVDVANGALQFSILAGGDPAHWPDHLDEERFTAFMAGYESINPLSSAERSAIPSLMSEALIAECVPPITETGSMGRWSGFRVLQMVRRKLTWLEANSSRLTAALTSG